MKYLTVQEISCTVPGMFGARLDPLMEALLTLEAADSTIEDPDLTADLGTGRVDVELTVEAPDPAAAMVKALAILRAAVRAVADITPGWQTTPAAMHAAPAEDILASAC